MVYQFVYLEKISTFNNDGQPDFLVILPNMSAIKIILQ